MAPQTGSSLPELETEAGAGEAPAPGPRSPHHTHPTVADVRGSGPESRGALGGTPVTRWWTEAGEGPGPLPVGRNII